MIVVKITSFQMTLYEQEYKTVKDEMYFGSSSHTELLLHNKNQPDLLVLKARWHWCAVKTYKAADLSDEFSQSDITGRLFIAQVLNWNLTASLSVPSNMCHGKNFFARF